VRKNAGAILRPEQYDDWLSSTNPEFARALIGLYPADELYAQPAPKLEAKLPEASAQSELF